MSKLISAYTDKAVPDFKLLIWQWQNASLAKTMCVCVYIIYTYILPKENRGFKIAWQVDFQERGHARRITPNLFRQFKIKIEVVYWKNME